MTSRRSNSSRLARSSVARRRAENSSGFAQWRLTVLYWSLPLFLAGILRWLSDLSTHQIRYEELAESVRSVFWLDHRLVYDGVYTNVGWYTTLLLAYKVFGFSLFTAKAVRLVVHLVGLYAIAALLRRHLTVQVAMLPLIVIGLSPTLLYFSTLQTSYGLDLPYAAICLLLLLSVRPGASDIRTLGKMFLCGLVAAIAAMSYPTFLLYLPSLLLVGIWWFRLSRSAGQPLSARSIGAHLLAAVVGFALPVAAAFVFVRSRGLLLYDPQTHAGLFRGGGRFAFDPIVLGQSIKAVLGDLFIRGQSYYFEVSRPDWSGLLAPAAVACVAATGVYLFVTRQADRLLLASVALLAVLSVIVPNLSDDGSPGLRRCTGVLAAFFVLFAFAWRYYLTVLERHSWLRRAGLVLCLLLPLDGAMKLPSLAADLAADSVYMNHDWFTMEGTPQQSLETLLASMEQGHKLMCPLNQEGKIVPCRYQEIYPAIAGAIEWNGLHAIDIRALDWKTGQDITLSPTLWATNYYPTCTRSTACR